MAQTIKQQIEQWQKEIESGEIKADDLVVVAFTTEDVIARAKENEGVEMSREEANECLQNYLDANESDWQELDYALSAFYEDKER